MLNPYVLVCSCVCAMSSWLETKGATVQRVRITKKRGRQPVHSCSKPDLELNGKSRQGVEKVVCCSRGKEELNLGYIYAQIAAAALRALRLSSPPLASSARSAKLPGAEADAKPPRELRTSIPFNRPKLQLAAGPVSFSFQSSEVLSCLPR